ncbi:sensor histidine kinase [Metabacillus herbersteinensis]|uniref:histidine kinase n=1 Tax=Metabacillus herbersteinensis TaxID=283816 RepID=A0ABV6GMC4_9BACI
MKINSITVKLGVTILMLFLIVLFPLVYTIDQLFSAYFYNQKMEQIDYFAAKYSETITDVADSDSYHMFEMISELNNVDLFIFDEEGTILNSTGLLDFKEGELVGLKISEPILEKQHLSMEYQDSKTDQNYLISGEAIIINNRVNGGLVVVSNMASINSSIEQMRTWLMISVMGSLFIAVGFTFFISRKLSAPLLDMVLATREIAKGPLKTGLVVTSNDEIGTLAKAITELGRELEDFRTNRKEFFANISHELRTPISYIKGYSHVLRKSLYRNEEEKNQYLDIINDEATRLTTLINDLFELSKMEEGKLDLNLELIDISDIVISSINKVNLKANEKNIKIILDLATEIPLFYTDGRRLEQVLINLLENSIRYSDKGRSIMVKVAYDKKYINISIVDQGIGIPKEDIPYIFERFYRVEKSRTRAAGGTGLGLAIVKNIIELLKGKIEVESMQEVGTTFKIRFPLNEVGSEK